MTEFNPEAKNVIRTDGNAYALDFTNGHTCLMSTAICIDGTLDPNWYLTDPQNDTEYWFQVAMVATLEALHAVNNM